MAKKIEENEGEIWKEIPGYEERYLISNKARVKSIIKNIHVILKKSLIEGRLNVKLYDKRGRGKNINCGRIVAKVFIREAQENEVIDYIDGNKLNDEVSNLRYTTRSEVVKNSPNHSNRSIKGESNGMAILTISQVKEIRQKRSSGNTLNQLKEEYKVSIGCIHNIVSHKNWKNI